MGPVALVGGHEFHQPARDLDATLLELSGGREVAFLPTANAAADPEADVATARRHFKALGAKVTACNIFTQKQAREERFERILRDASLVYLGGGSPRKLATVLRGSPSWQAILDANAAGGVLAGSSAGAMVLFEIMLAPRWARPAEGLGLFKGAAVLPHHDTWLHKRHKVIGSKMLPTGIRIIGIDECTGLIAEGANSTVVGPGSVTIYRDGSSQLTISQADPARPRPF